MTRICSNCEFENQDDYDFCAKCGTPLVDGVGQNNFILYGSFLSLFQCVSIYTTK